MTQGARAAAARLIEMGQSGALDVDMERLGVRLLTVFGSSVDPAWPAEPNDIDVAVSWVDLNASPRPPLLELIQFLERTTAFSPIDVGGLDEADVVFRAEALCGPMVYEQQPGTYANEQMTAISMRLDSEWLRLLDLRLMATR